MWDSWRKYLQEREERREAQRQSMEQSAREVERRRALRQERDQQAREIGRRLNIERRFWFFEGQARKQVRVNIVADDGRQWINVTTVKPFGLASSAWLGRAGSRSRHRRKQGLKRQTAKMLRGAAHNTVEGRAPRVIVRFKCGVSRPVAEALREMGAEVEGDIIEPPMRRSV